MSQWSPLRPDKNCDKMTNSIKYPHRQQDWTVNDRVTINIQDDILKLHGLGLLEKLLADKTTKQNILWATNAYRALGPQYECNEEITSTLITGPHCSVIKTRARKAAEQQSSRTRQHGEVSTPLWVCRKMNDYIDEMWNSKARWQKYVDARVLEIACGEAPFLASRYDAETGEGIPVSDRIGLLDRKLQEVNKNTQTEEDWLKWAFRALQATYGYEFQGDNLLISRVNLLMTFEEYLWERWRRKPARREYEKAANIIAWNIFQMDGLRGMIPYGTAEEEFQEIDWFGMLGGDTEKGMQPRCLVHNWTGGGSVEYLALPTRGKRAMKFDFVIGNPPYQEETESESTRMLPIYNLFMDEAYKIGRKVELITPARFLFNAGQTPKNWNQKMLSDPHLTVLLYEPDGTKIFPNTDIKGGIAVTYRDSTKEMGAINIFVPWVELESILEKAGAKTVEESLTDIADSSPVYDLKNIYSDHPNYKQYIADGGRHAQLKTNVLNINPIFTDTPTECDDYKVCGLVSGKRGYKFCHRRYIKPKHKSLFKYKILVPKAAGSGHFGDALPPMFVVGPNVAFTQTYISIGIFDNEGEANHLLKYLKTKICRSLLYVLKVTQDNLPAVWRYIPKQDFTSSSDIDWTKSVPEIDQQLYAKYGLDEREIQFIETHVKEME